MNQKRCRAYESWVLRDSEPAAASGMVIRFTGLPSRSALVAPPLRLAALRWRGAFVILGRLRPPPGVSTACLVAVARFSGRPFPGEPHTALCRSELERWRHNTVYCTPAGARTHVLRGARGSRAPVSTRCAQRWDVPGSTFCRWRWVSMSKMSNLAILGLPVTEKRVPGTRKAVETTGGDRWRSIGSRDPGRRREASWSRGAAECDRRPVLRRTSLGSSAPGPVSPLHRPAVAFGAGRASAPARRPAVA
jgi:hypothetical protein